MEATPDAAGLMGLSYRAALWFAPFLVPICVYVAYNDMARMKIPNVMVGAMVLVFVVVGLIALPFDIWAGRWLHLVIVLLAGMALNAAGVMGAGDAKFAAAAAPFIALQDLRLMIVLFAACLIAGYAAHRITRMTPLTKLAPHWESWDSGKRFPMGLPLGATLALYLLLGLRFGV